VKKPIKDMNAPELWGVYFQYLRNKKKRGIINEIIKQEEGIAMASRVLMTISRDEVERARLISEEKYILDTQSNLTYARQQIAKSRARGMKKGLAEGLAEGKAVGKAEGRAEGRDEKALEIARKMKAIGRPEPEIAEITGLPAETIQKL
jgi:flagellar biosynthesis/type III secretory pathway protein FliH